MLKESFAIQDQAHLQIDVVCDLRIEESDDDRVHVVIDGDEESLKGFEIYSEDDDTVVVNQKDQIGFRGSSRNVVIGNGMSVTQINGATYINSVRAGSGVHIGEVYINGKRVSGGFTDESSEDVQLVSCTVHCPPNSTLNLDLGGQSALVSSVHLEQASIDCSGQVNATITSVGDLDLDLSGQCRFKVGSVTGKLMADISGQCNVDVKGAFGKVVVDISGQSHFTTHGICQGNYIAEASGMSSISHYGSVRGKVRKDVSGIATIDV